MEVEIEAGKHYYTRDGGVAGPMQRRGLDPSLDPSYPWASPETHGTITWDNQGRRLSARADGKDLISLVNMASLAAKVPHKHAAVIKAWADGAEIQWRHGPAYHWQNCNGNPLWEPGVQYRVKPEVKPNVVSWAGIYENGWAGDAAALAKELVDKRAVAILRIEIDRNDPANPVLVSATLEKP